MAERLIIKVTRNTLPQIKDKYPFLYLERGRIEIDDSSVKWIDSDGNVIRLPIATINCLLLGPGTTVTHEAIKVMASSNCTLCWVGEDSFRFYACGVTPTSNTRNMKHQMMLASDSKKSLAVARRMFLKRFPNEDISTKTLKELMGMEGLRVSDLYYKKAKEYDLIWSGRRYTPGKFELSDMTNKILTASNDALYAIITSCVISLGFSPHIGFVHSGSPLPFVYDIADLYKEDATIDLAFSLTKELAGEYNRQAVISAFRKRISELNILSKVGEDIKFLLDMKK
ncbi:MAG: type I-E CRISPR-associated endonuclease Cas1 [Deferribacterales bacterium]|nr:type I-E CRISPR-associated endonuclease Cas1 [Deferribacterales bacterium]